MSLRAKEVQQMLRRYKPPLAKVILLGLMTLMIGADVQAQIAFVSEKNDNADIYVMDANGQNHRRLTQNRHGGWSASWSPNAKSIAFVSSRDGDWRTADIYVMNTGGRKLQNLTKDLWRNSVPTWSPDGKRIAFSSQRGNDWRDIDIYVIHINGGNIQNLTKSFHGSGWAPSWSPDGKHIAFVSAAQGDEPEIYVMNVNDGIPQKITDNHWLDNDPSWSPDGKRIAFSSKRGADWNKRNGDWDIYVMDADGGNIQNLTNNPLAHDRQPVWYRPAFAVEPAGKQFTMWGWLKQGAR